METISQDQPLTKIKIDDTDIFIEEIGPNKGKITISNTYGHNYSMFWGAMGGTLKDFLCRINSSYFAGKLIDSQSSYVMDVKGTFSTLRKFIATEMGLPWYKHMEFQTRMREVLREFQESCEESGSESHFVDNFFRSFVERLDFYLIKNEWERKSLEKDFKGISEQWHFIQSKESPKYLWLVSLHEKLKNKLAVAA